MYGRSERNGILAEAIKGRLQAREELSYKIREARIELDELHLSALQDKSPEEIFNLFKERLDRCALDHRNPALLKDLCACIDFIAVSKGEFAHVTFNVPKILLVFGISKKHPESQSARPFLIKR